MQHEKMVQHFSENTVYSSAEHLPSISFRRWGNRRASVELFKRDKDYKRKYL